MQSTIGIVENEFVSAVGLQNILQSFLPTVDIVIYESIDALKKEVERQDGNRPYFVHFFVSEHLLEKHRDYFHCLPQITFALIRNRQLTTINDFPCLDISLNQQAMLEQLICLRQAGGKHHSNNENNSVLSKREQEVLKLIVKGKLNKEIADELFISLNTVITHRAHITNKLGFRSVPALTVYAVMNGLIKSSEIYTQG